MASESRVKRPAAALLVSATLLCASCASVPPACPKLPDPPALVELGPSYLSQMRSFLSGSLPEPTNYELRSMPAKRGLAQ